MNGIDKVNDRCIILNVEDVNNKNSKTCQHSYLNNLSFFLTKNRRKNGEMTFIRAGLNYRIHKI